MLGVKPVSMLVELGRDLLHKHQTWFADMAALNSAPKSTCMLLPECPCSESSAAGSWEAAIYRSQTLRCARREWSKPKNLTHYLN